MDITEWENTPKALRLAVMLNSYRVIPRAILIVYYTFFIKAWFFIVEWFVGIDWNSLPTDQIVGTAAVAATAGFPAMILGVLTKILMQLTESYWNGGPKGS